MIAAGDRIASVLAHDERLLDVFVAASPTFEKLRSAAMRKTMARLVTVEQAARIAGIEPGRLVAQLNAALGEVAPGTSAAPAVVPVPDAAPAPALVPVPAAALVPVPAAWRTAPLVDLDVREALRAGQEPFSRILDAARALPVGSVLRVRAIFEPAPLYAVLAKYGLAHATERLADDDWCAWFHHGATSVAPRVEATVGMEAAPTGDDVIVLDVRGLEPPEPMVRTLEALTELPRGKTLVQLNVRVPQYLLPKLAERGFTYEARIQGPDLVRLFIRHR